MQAGALSTFFSENAASKAHAVALDFQDVHSAFHIGDADAEGGLPRR